MKNCVYGVMKVCPLENKELVKKLPPRFISAHSKFQTTDPIG